MTLELVGTLAAVGTFVVIAATAIAAVIQLRHLRASNLLSSMLTINEDWLSPEIKQGRNFINNELAEKLKEKSFRAHLMEGHLTPETTVFFAVGNHFETLGVFVKNGLVSKDVALDTWAFVIKRFWENMAPAVEIIRRTSGQSVYENFEYLAVLSSDYLAHHPRGAYPKGMQRWKTEDKWLADDQ